LVPISGQYAHAGGRARFVQLALGFVAWTLSYAVVDANAASRERVSLPYSCTTERGRLKVEPAADKSYQIIGQREQQVHTYCPDQSGTKCRTWTVHRFNVSCGGTRTSWSELVAAATASDRANVAVENGQLLLRVAPGANWRDRICGELERAPWRGPATWERCQQTRAGNGAKPVLRSHMVALPRGFAPLALVGARILPDAEQSARTVAIDGEPLKLAHGDAAVASERTIVSDLPAIAQHRRVQQAPVQMPFNEPAYENDELAILPVDTSTRTSALVNEERQPVRSERTEPARTEAKPGSGTVEAFAAVAMAPSAATVADLPVREEPLVQRVKVELGKAWPMAWTTRVEATPSTASREDYSSAIPSTLVQALVAGLLGTALLLTVTVTRRRRTVRIRSSRADPDLVGQSAYTEGDGERAVALRTKSDGHIALITNALERLSTVAPLRNALSRELQSSERRLAVVIAAIGTSKATPEDWTKARRRLERIAQDLDRLQQISDSAVHSLSGLSVTRSLPRDKDEAYATLGITPGVSEPILKKLVEALRVSWHPDLAKGEADRALRDARIKEINVAWDLITGKRQSE
jgi:hypothetical protein